MSLTTCPDCGNQVSTEAVACPNCGRPASSRVTHNLGSSAHDLLIQWDRLSDEDRAKQARELILRATPGAPVETFDWGQLHAAVSEIAAGGVVSNIAQAQPPAASSAGRVILVLAIIIGAVVALNYLFSGKSTTTESAPSSSSLQSAESAKRNQDDLLGHRDLVQAVHQLITTSGYECPVITALWNRGTSPYGLKVEALCGPNDGSRNTYPDLHYAVYPERLKVNPCSTYGAFSSDCS